MDEKEWKNGIENDEREERISFGSDAKNFPYSYFLYFLDLFYFYFLFFIFVSHK